MALRPLHHTFGPHVDGAAARKALGLLLRPWRWRTGPANERLRIALSTGFGGDAFLFASGRQGLFALLQALKIGKGDEVIVQAYTCIVVPNAIAATGAKAVYADIERETLNLDPEDVAKRITPRTKAVICQHTFGIPAPLSELQTLCAKHGIPLIEDCAHVLPDAAGPLGVARTGKYAVLSFGRDKAVSGVTGGAVLSRDETASSALRASELKASSLGAADIVRLLCYPLVYALARPLYGLGIGKALLFLAGRLRVLPAIVTPAEKRGLQGAVVHTMPHACAALALASLRRLDALNSRRRKLASIYLIEGRTRGWPVVEGACAGLPLQKLPLFTVDAERIRRTLKAKNIHLHDGWTGCVVCPEMADADAAGYVQGTDPRAETACEAILSLPTHPTMTDAQAHALVRALDPLLHRP